MIYKKYDKEIVRKLLQLSNNSLSYRKLSTVREKVGDKECFKSAYKFKAEVLKELSNNGGRLWNDIYLDYFKELSKSNDIWHVLTQDDNRNFIVEEIAKCMKKTLKNK